MVRLAEKSDLEAIGAIYAAAREYMANNGNPTQWGALYPPPELTMSDVENERLFVVAGDGGVHGVFAFIVGEDPAYSTIEDGSWKCDQPYGTIHRIAGDGVTGGVFDECMLFCKGIMDHLRIDTHANNRTMLHCIQKHGFQRSGIVYMPDGTPRIAFEYCRQAADA